MQLSQRTYLLMLVSSYLIQIVKMHKIVVFLVIIQIASFFWLITWIWLISRTSLLITWCFSWFDFKFENQVWGSRRARGAERRPERSPEGPSGSPHLIFKFEIKSRKTSCYSAKKCEILSQIHVTQPKIMMLYVW